MNEEEKKEILEVRRAITKEIQHTIRRIKDL
jgi:hypothetical protein